MHKITQTSFSAKTIAKVVVSIFTLAGIVAWGTLSVTDTRALSSTPSFTYVTDGQVTALEKIGNEIFFGGNFNSIRPHVGHGLPTDMATGAAATSFSKVNGTISAVVSDGADGWFIGGAFSQVGAEVRQNLAHVYASGLVDPLWIADVTGTVTALAYDGSSLYIGGSFTAVGGQARSNLASLNASSAAVSAWNPGANAGVSDIAVDGATVYAAGAFSTAGGAARASLVALDATTGTATAWNPGADAGASSLLVDSTNVYVGGQFITLAGAARSYIGAVDKTTGVATAWNPSADGAVQDLASDGTSIFAAGNFTTIGGAARTGLAGLDMATGAATAWNPALNGSAQTISTDGTNVYVGGGFTSAGGSARENAAGISIATGSATGYNPQINGAVSALALSSSQVYLGGGFTGAGTPTTRTNAAAINETTGALTSWAPNPDGPVNTLATDGASLFVGGNFSTIGGQTRSNIAKVDTTAGLADATFDPAANAFVNDIVTDGTTVFAGGGFTTIGGASRSYLAALDPTTGLATAFDPAPNATVNALALDGTTLYLGGGFIQVDATLRLFVAAVDTTATSTPYLIAGWNPGADAAVNELSLGTTTVYAGGAFTNIAGQSRNYVAELDKTTGTASAWNPSADASVGAIVADTTNTTVYAGGGFATIGGASRTGLAALDQTTGSATPWNVTLDASGQAALDMQVASGQLYAVGSLGAGQGFVTWFSKPIVQFAVASSSGPESTTPAVISVTLSGTDTQDVTISYTITGGTATNGSDYILASGTVTIPAGSTSATIQIPIIDDALVEGDETITLLLSGPSGNAVLGTVTGHTYTILDDDVTPPISGGGINVVRFAGDNPTDQAISIAQVRFPNTGDAQGVMMARGDLIVDALTSSVHANLTDSALLLTDPASLTPATLAEIQRLLASTSDPIYIAGGLSAINAQVETDLRNAGYTNITRFAGDDRRHTAGLIAADVQTRNATPATKVELTEDQAFADAFSVGAVAGRSSDGIVEPIILNPRGSAVLDVNVSVFLKNNPNITVEIIGGDAAVPTALETAITSAYPGVTITRTAGTDRFDTNAQLVNANYASYNTIVFARGDQGGLPGAQSVSGSQAVAGGVSFFAALLADTYAADLEVPLMLVTPTTVPTPISNLLTANRGNIGTIYLTGDLSEISNAVEQFIVQLLT